MAGRVELITGPMFAGKTSELIQRMYWHGKHGYQNIIVPSIVPMSGDYIETHNNHRIMAEKSSDLEATFVRIFQSEKNRALAKDSDGVYVPGENPLAVAIDEVQFFPQEAVAVIKKAAREWGWTVICAGLNFDFKKDTWGIIEAIYSIANKTIECWAECAVCGDFAAFTQRLHLDGTPARADEPRIVIDDGSVRYEPRCWRCHQVG